MSGMEARTPATETEVWLNRKFSIKQWIRIDSPLQRQLLPPNPHSLQPHLPLPPTHLIQPPPANTAETNQYPQQQNTLNQLTGLDFSTTAMIATIFTVGLSIAIILTHSRNRLKDNTHATKIRALYLPKKSGSLAHIAKAL